MKLTKFTNDFYDGVADLKNRQEKKDVKNAVFEIKTASKVIMPSDYYNQLAKINNTFDNKIIPKNVDISKVKIWILMSKPILGFDRCYSNFHANNQLITGANMYKGPLLEYNSGAITSNLCIKELHQVANELTHDVLIVDLGPEYHFFLESCITRGPNMHLTWIEQNNESDHVIEVHSSKIDRQFFNTDDTRLVVVRLIEKGSRTIFNKLVELGQYHTYDIDTINFMEIENPKHQISFDSFRVHNELSCDDNLDWKVKILDYLRNVKYYINNNRMYPQNCAFENYLPIDEYDNRLIDGYKFDELVCQIQNTSLQK